MTRTRHLSVPLTAHGLITTWYLNIYLLPWISMHCSYYIGGNFLFFGNISGEAVHFHAQYSTNFYHKFYCVNFMGLIHEADEEETLSCEKGARIHENQANIKEICWYLCPAFLLNPIFRNCYLFFPISGTAGQTETMSCLQVAMGKNVNVDWAKPNAYSDSPEAWCAVQLTLQNPLHTCQGAYTITYMYTDE